jgi:DNA-binding response OmpR family regulator
MLGLTMARILVAEDEVNARDALVMFFEAQGFEVRAAADGEDAIKIGGDFRPHVLITDWLLEGECSGVTVARTLARAAPGVAIILISGYPLAELRAITADLDVKAYLEKPISLFELGSVVDRVIDESDNGDELTGR